MTRTAHRQLRRAHGFTGRGTPAPVKDQTARERTVGMARGQEQACLADQRTQPQPADGGIGALTDVQGREPDTGN
ncbi:hypothetical protein [Kocuria tytonicola]|uniref:hypothetical protein n=1 Tax=Kocuria tytonicola TaxID=2055946 RepID=UPI000F519E0C|nr:hypothetical protein [Kocuria tytonicola]